MGNRRSAAFGWWQRGGPGFRGVGGAAADLAIYGTLVTTGNTWILPSGTTGPLGSDTMTIMAWLRMPSDGNASATQEILDRRATGGFDIFLTTGSRSLSWRVKNGVGADVSASVDIPTGQTVVAVYARMGGGFLDLRIDETDATPAAIVGYTSPGTSAMGLGCSEGGAFPALDVELYGFVFAESTRLSNAQCLAHRDACEAAGQVVDFPVGTSFRWVGADAYALPANWAAATGTASAAKAGTPTPVSTSRSYP